MEHQCNQIGTIQEMKGSIALTNKDISYMKLEVSEIKTIQKEGFSSIHEKIDTFITKVEDTYATKQEVKDIKDDVKTIKDNSSSKKIEWIRTWGALIVALITAGSVVLSAYLNK